MINHARNLLLNVSPQRMAANDAGYEYVAKDYVPFRFAESLAVIHKVLFGSSPDNKFLNLRAKELLTYVHETEFASYIYRLDPRVTYWPRNESPAFFYNKKVTIAQISGAPRRLGVGGTFNASNVTGTAERNFILDLRSVGGVFNAELQPYGVPIASKVETFTSLADAPIITAPDTAIRINLANASAISSNRMLTEIGDLFVLEAYGPAGYLMLENADDSNILPFTELPRLASTDSELVARWAINMQANPSPAITTLMPTLELLGEPIFIDLFGVAEEEPYATFKNLWFDHPLPNYRLAGLTLAFIYRAEEQRVQND